MRSLGSSRPVLENLIPAEPLELKIVCRSRYERGRGGQPDDFALEDPDAVTRSLTLHHVEDPVDRSLLEISQVHRHLHDSPVSEVDAHRLDVSKAAAAVS